MPTEKTKPTPKELPTDGMSRYTGLKPYIAVSREKWRILVLKGEAPQPIRLCKSHSKIEPDDGVK